MTTFALTGKEVDTWPGVEQDGKPVVHRELQLWGFEIIHPTQWVQGKIVEFESHDVWDDLQVDDECYLVLADIDDFRWPDRIVSGYVYPLELFRTQEEADSFLEEYLLAHKHGNPTFVWSGNEYPHVCLVDGVKLDGLRALPLEFDGDRRD